MKEHLERARVAIASADWRAALGPLVEAWRETRVVRLAKLVERVAERLPAAPIEGKTVKDRTAAWLAAAKSAGLADLGSLLATPWPGKWPDNVAVLEALARFGPEPRIAMAVTQRVIDTPYTVTPALAFYRLALSMIAQANDARTKPILEADVARMKRGRPWTELFKATIADISAEQVLSREANAAIAAVEALFGHEMASEATNEKTEDDFLRAIYRDPADDTARLVYADWLTERGDPRGEFITLQLTPSPSAAAQKREAALLKKHKAAWMGALVHALEGAVFTRGFVSSGTLASKAQDKELRDPAWALVEALDLTYFEGATLSPVLTAPWLRTLRRVSGISEADAVRIAKDGLAPQLEEIWLRVREGVVADGRTQLRVGFPRLKSLGVGGGEADVVAFVEDSLPAALERLVVLDAYYPALAAAARAVERAKLALPVIAARTRHGWDGPAWRFELSRDKRGRFTRLLAGPGHASFSLPSADGLTNQLDELRDLTELVIGPNAGCAWSRRDVARVEAQLAKLKRLHTIHVPWDRAVRGADANAPRIKLIVSGPATDQLWDALTAPPLSLVFDSMAANGRGHEALPADGLAHVKKMLAKRNTHWVQVYAKQSADTMNVHFGRTSAHMTVPRTASFDRDACLAWIAAFLDRTGIRGVTAPFLRIHNDMVVDAHVRGLGPLAMTHAWIMCFEPRLEASYDFDELAKRARTIEGVTVVRAKKHLLVAFGDAPTHPPDEATRKAFEAVLAETFKN